MSKQNLLNTITSRPGSSVTFGSLSTLDHRGRLVNYISDGLTDPSDWANQAMQTGAFPGIPNLPLKTVTIMPFGDGQGIEIKDYGLPRGGAASNLNRNNEIRIDAETKTLTLEWWADPGTDGTGALDAASGTVSLEWDEAREANWPTSWRRTVKYIHLMIPTVLGFNPYNSVASMIDRLNSNSFTIDGASFSAGQLWFEAPTVDRIQRDDETFYLVTYNYLAREDKWVRQVALDFVDGSPPTATLEDRYMTSTTSFSNPPMGDPEDFGF